MPRKRDSDMTTRELSYDNLRTINAEGNKETRLSISVFNGSAGLTVFQKNIKPFRFNLSVDLLTLLASDLESAISGPPSKKIVTNITDFDPETKKRVPKGTIVVGNDDAHLIYIGVNSPVVPQSKFVIKAALSVDRSEPMTDRDRSVLAAKGLVQQLRTHIPIAMMLTNFKKEFNSNNRGGNNNNRPTNNQNNQSNNQSNDDYF